jgi:4-alpha-glucanotransferase
VALPVFAARTQNSVGCGEFMDLIPLIEFADGAGMRLIQVRTYPPEPLCQLILWDARLLRSC